MKHNNSNTKNCPTAPRGYSPAPLPADQEHSKPLWGDAFDHPCGRSAVLVKKNKKSSGPKDQKIARDYRPDTKAGNWLTRRWKIKKNRTRPMKALLGLASMSQISFLETEPRLRRSSRLDSLAAGSRDRLRQPAGRQNLKTAAVLQAIQFPKAVLVDVEVVADVDDIQEVDESNTVDLSFIIDANIEGVEGGRRSVLLPVNSWE